MGQLAYSQLISLLCQLRICVGGGCAAQVLRTGIALCPQITKKIDMNGRWDYWCDFPLNDILMVQDFPGANVTASSLVLSLLRAG